MPLRLTTVAAARRRALEHERLAVLELFPDLASFSRRNGQVGPLKRAQDRPPRLSAIQRRPPSHARPASSRQWRRPTPRDRLELEGLASGSSPLCPGRLHPPGRSTDAVRSSLRATVPTVWPSSSTRRTAPSLNSSVNRRRGRRAARPQPILEVASASRTISTGSDQCHAELGDCRSANRHERSHSTELQVSGPDPETLRSRAKAIQRDTWARGWRESDPIGVFVDSSRSASLRAYLDSAAGPQRCR